MSTNPRPRVESIRYTVQHFRGGLPFDRARYERESDSAKNGSERQKRDLVDRHFLKVLFGEDYDKLIDQSVVKVLTRKAREGDLSGVDLERIRANGLAHYERPHLAKVTGKHAHGNGWCVVAEHYLPLKITQEREVWQETLFDGPERIVEQEGDHQGIELIARTFYNVFADAKTRKLAGEAQTFFHDVAEHAWISDLKTTLPTYSQGKILGNLFLPEAKDLQEIFRTASLETKYEHLRAVAAMDVQLGHYAKETMDLSVHGITERVGLYLAQRQARVFKEEDYTSLLFEKVFFRAAPEEKAKARNGRELLDKKGKVKDSIVFREVLEREDTPESWQTWYGLIGSIDSLDSLGDPTYVHGDTLPSNMMVHEDKYGTRYTPIDFEFACIDGIERSLAQRWIKSDIYDHLGEARKLDDGRTIEAALVADVQDTYAKLGQDFSTEKITQAVAKGKIRNYLLWAGRYKKLELQALEKDAARKAGVPEKQGKLASYYGTLSILELERQGILDASDASDHRIALLADLFGPQLTADEMQSVHDELVPQIRVHSVYKDAFESNLETQLQGIVEQGKRRRRVETAKRWGGGALATLLSLGAIGSYAHGLEFDRYLAEMNHWTERRYELRAEGMINQINYSGIHDDGRPGDAQRSFLTSKRARDLAEEVGIDYGLVKKVVDASWKIMTAQLGKEKMKDLWGYPLMDVYEGLGEDETKPQESMNNATPISYEADENYKQGLLKLKEVLVEQGVDPENPFADRVRIRTAGTAGDYTDVIKAEKPLRRALANFFKPTHMEDDDLSGQYKVNSYPLMRLFGFPDWEEKQSGVVYGMLNGILNECLDSWCRNDDYTYGWTNTSYEFLEEKDAQLAKTYPQHRKRQREQDAQFKRQARAQERRLAQQKRPHPAFSTSYPR